VALLCLAAGMMYAGCSSGPSRLVGGTCASNDDCRDLCATGGDFPGGFCTTPCFDDGDCPGMSVCAEFDGDGICAFPCDSDPYCQDLLEGAYECRDQGTPDGRVVLESVIEEECTGNGTLATVLAGHMADAAIIAEPFGAAITTSQVGVLWFHVRIRGVAVHAAEERRGVNAIEKSYEVMQALRGLEAELNVAPPAPYDRFSHPINLNVGAIRGGDWASTVPGGCVTTYRIALYPGTSVRDLQDRIEAVVAEAAVEDPAIFAHPPEVRYAGFTSEGYEIADDHPLVTTLSGAFARAAGTPPALVATTGTTDAGILGTVGGTPAVCFGPYAERAHAANERVWVPSVVQTAQVMASFVREWCGVG